MGTDIHANRHNYLSKIERGLKFPKPDILTQLAEGLDVEVYELFKTDFVPKSRPNDNKKLIDSLSKEMNQKVTSVMESVFRKYSK